MRKTVAACILAVVALFGFVDVGHAAPQVRIEDAKRSSPHMSFTLYTPGGPLLTSDNFEVTINGIKADGVVATASAGTRQPAGAVLVLDSSGSMAGRPIAEAKKAARLFINTVEKDTLMALVRFSDDVVTLSSYTGERRQLLQRVKSVDARGETALYDAVLRATSLVRSRPVEQRNIVVLSDGGDTVSNATLNEAIDSATNSGATVFIVGLKSPEYSVGTIRRLATDTGGQTLVTADATQLSRIFKGLAQTLISRYEVSVVNPDPGATLLDVTVQVSGETTASGSRQFRFPAPAEPDETITVSRMPLEVLLIIVGLGVAIITFLVSEFVRHTRKPPAHRLMWYDDGGNEQIDKDELINAAILDRAKQLATRLADRAGYLERIDKTIDAAGLRWRPGEVIVASALLAFTGLLVGAVVGAAFVGLLTGLLGLVAPALFIRIKAARRRRAFEQQLPEVLQMMSGALRAGYSIQQAMAAVAEDGQPPARDEFRRATAEIRLGGTIDEALRQMAQRLGVVDFDWVVMAVEIQREVGGDLAEVLDAIAQTIRERERLRRHIKALTAEGRLSGWILGGLPFFMAGMLLLINPEYLATLFETGLGLAMIASASVLMVIGAFWMRKIIRIEV
jgi:tight adherence protein B